MHTIVEAPTVPQVEVLVTEALDTQVALRLRPVLDDAVALHPSHLIVDLTGCPRLDAAGIDLLVDVHRRVWADGGRLTLRGMSARLYRLLEIARVDRVLHTASAPPGYQPQHRATRRAPASSPDDSHRTSPAEEVRWWEPASSG